MDGEIRSGFTVDKILDYVQYAYDNFEQLHDGKKHYLNDGEVYAHRIGDFVKLGKPGVHKGTGFAFVRNVGTKADIHMDEGIPYRFDNGVPFKQVIERTGNKLHSYIEKYEITKDFVFHTYFHGEQVYILTYEELKRVQEMSTKMTLEMYLQSFYKK